MSSATGRFSNKSPLHMGGTIPVTAEPPRATNTRFRSFAERYLIERIASWPQGSDPATMAHQTAIDARTAYKMIKEVSYTLEPND